jgi:hypothetical protein
VKWAGEGPVLPGPATTTTTTAPVVRPPVVVARTCRVPKLARLTLAKAKAKLKKAGCRLGKVRKPRGVAARRLVVRRQSRKAGRTVPLATKVGVTLKRRR